jgi:dUTP pyrophosphatase
MNSKTWSVDDAANAAARDFGGGDSAVRSNLPALENIQQDTDYVEHIPIRVKRLPHYTGLTDPKRATIGSSGCDLFCASEDTILLNKMGARAIIPTGLAMAVPFGFEIQIRPRSGLAAKHGLTVLNTPGTIDSDYRGEIGVIIVNTSTDKFYIERGERIAQMVVQRIVIPEFVFVDDLDETERGAGAYGSTGNT